MKSAAFFGRAKSAAVPSANWHKGLSTCYGWQGFSAKQHGRLRAWALTEVGSQGQNRACVQAFSCGGSLQKRCPHVNTRLAGLLRAARYSASCSQGVDASKVAPKFVGPVESQIRSAVLLAMLFMLVGIWTAGGKVAGKV